RERLERSGLFHAGRSQHWFPDRRTVHGLRDVVHEQRGVEQSAVGRVHAGRRRIGGRRTGGPPGRSVNRSEAQRADPLLLAQQRPVAGLELKGVVIKADKDDMRDVYGEGITAKEGLQGNKVTTPASVQAFSSVLA